MKKFFVALLSIGALVSLIRKKFQKSKPENEEALFERTEKKKDENEEVEGSVGLININQAELEGFLQIPGIGEDLASKILAYRNEFGDFKSIDDLLNVNGIGEKKLDAIREFITID